MSAMAGSVSANDVFKGMNRVRALRRAGWVAVGLQVPLQVTRQARD